MAHTGGTRLDYLESGSPLTGEARVVEIRRADDAADGVVLDATLFHPQGGGQPADSGRLSSGTSHLEVAAVRAVDGVVVHLGSFSGSPFAVGETVRQQVDGERRRLHRRLHSAGHLLDVAMREIGYPFRATRGHHFPGEAYVEYDGVVPAEERPETIERLQRAARERIAADHPVEVDHVDPATSDGEPVRTVRVVPGPGCPCGGTHVESLAEIGELTVVKLRVKSGRTRVRYALEPSSS